MNAIRVFTYTAGIGVFPRFQEFIMSTVTLQAVPRRRAPRLAAPIAEAAVALATRVAGWLRPRPLSRAEEAYRLYQLANQYHSQPSFAADLRAAADRHADRSE
jgi:hypothetical protein